MNKLIQKKLAYFRVSKKRKVQLYGETKENKKLFELFQESILKPIHSYTNYWITDIKYADFERRLKYINTIDNWLFKKCSFRILLNSKNNTVKLHLKFLSYNGYTERNDEIFSITFIVTDVDVITKLLNVNSQMTDILEAASKVAHEKHLSRQKKHWCDQLLLKVNK